METVLSRKLKADWNREKIRLKEHLLGNIGYASVD
jgi:hypothetical protein